MFNFSCQTGCTFERGPIRQIILFRGHIFHLGSWILLRCAYRQPFTFKKVLGLISRWSLVVGWCDADRSSAHTQIVMQPIGIPSAAFAARGGKMCCVVCSSLCSKSPARPMARPLLHLLHLATEKKLLGVARLGALHRVWSSGATARCFWVRGGFHLSPAEATVNHRVATFAGPDYI